MGGDVSDELLILLRGPEPPLHLLLVAAGVMPHARYDSLVIATALA